MDAILITWLHDVNFQLPWDTNIIVRVSGVGVVRKALYTRYNVRL